MIFENFNGWKGVIFALAFNLFPLILSADGLDLVIDYFLSNYIQPKKVLSHEEMLLQATLFERAAEEYKNIYFELSKEDPKRNDIFLYYAFALLAADECEKAVDVLLGHYGVESANVYHLLLGYAQKNLLNSAKAIESFNKYIEHPSSMEDEDLYGNVLCELGDLYLSEKNQIQAIKCFEKALQTKNCKEGIKLRAHTGLSKIYLLEKNFDKAEEYIKNICCFSIPFIKKDYLIFSLSSLKQLLKYYLSIQTKEELNKGLELLAQTSHHIIDSDDSGELELLTMEICLALLTDNNDDKYARDCYEIALNRGMKKNIQGNEREKFLYFQGCYEELMGQWENALLAYQQLINNKNLSSEYALKTLFKGAESAEKTGNNALAKEWRRILFEKYPDCDSAAEAYFCYFSLQDYLLGEKEAIRHLQRMPKKFPHSSLSITAHYVIGLDNKRERKSTDGKLLRRKDLLAAIESFQAAETLYDELAEKHQLPVSDSLYYATIHYHSVFERGKTNLQVAQDSQEIKKQIYLEYAEETLKKICNDFEGKVNSEISAIFAKEIYPNILEKATFYLGLCYIALENNDKAFKTFEKMLHNYRKHKITKSYYLASIHVEMGNLYSKKQSWNEALINYKHAEEASKGNLFNIDKKLELCLQQSLCYQELGDLDQAMLILSKVINSEAISSIRLQAMFRRAEIYEKQNRFELAQKQLEALASKSGEWSLAANAKLKLIAK